MLGDIRYDKATIYDKATLQSETKLDDTKSYYQLILMIMIYRMGRSIDDVKGIYFVCFLFKMDRFHVAVRLFRRRHQNVVRTSVTHSANAS